MSNYQNKYQNDVSAIANTIMTNLLAKKKGIDMEALMLQAQQVHFENIMQQEQQFQMEQMLRNHYQGRDTSFLGKLRTAFAGDNNGMSGHAPMPMLQQPQQNASVNSIADFLAQQSAPGEEYPAYQAPAPVVADLNRKPSEDEIPQAIKDMMAQFDMSKQG